MFPLQIRAALVAAAIFAATSCAPASRGPAPLRVAIGADTVLVPIDELGTRTYRGVQGGLYSNGLNLPPADHQALGIARRNAIRPLDVNGIPNGAGRYVLMSVGAGDVSSVWCSQSSAPPCEGWSVTGRAVSDPSVNHGPLVIVNGAIPGAEIDLWSNVASANYTRIRDTRLAPLGLSENQVQAVWMLIQDAGAPFPISASASDAAPLVKRIGATVRALKKRYPNLQLLFIASQAYRGYSPDGEPVAYESGFVVKWVIESQISQSRGKTPAMDGGDLSSLSGSAPWIAWGPYFWSRGAQPRVDGVAWLQSDYDVRGSSLSESGERKLSALLFDFFKTSLYTRCWFLAGPPCG